LSKYLCDSEVPHGHSSFSKILVRNKRGNVRTNTNICSCINIPICKLISYKYLRFRQFSPWGGTSNHVSLLKKSILVARFSIFLTFLKFALFGKKSTFSQTKQVFCFWSFCTRPEGVKCFLNLLLPNFLPFLMVTRLALPCISKFEVSGRSLCLLWCFSLTWIDTIKSSSVIISLLCLRVIWKSLQNSESLSIRTRTYSLSSIRISLAMILVTRFWIWWVCSSTSFSSTILKSVLSYGVLLFSCIFLIILLFKCISQIFWIIGITVKIIKWIT